MTDRLTDRTDQPYSRPREDIRVHTSYGNHISYNTRLISTYTQYIFFFFSYRDILGKLIFIFTSARFATLGADVVLVILMITVKGQYEIVHANFKKSVNFPPKVIFHLLTSSSHLKCTKTAWTKYFAILGHILTVAAARLKLCSSLFYECFLVAKGQDENREMLDAMAVHSLLYVTMQCKSR